MELEHTITDHHFSLSVHPFRDGYNDGCQALCPFHHYISSPAEKTILAQIERNITIFI